MPDPFLLDRSALQLETEALNEAAKAKALMNEGSDDAMAEAGTIQSSVAYLTSRAYTMHKEAQKLKAELKAMDDQIAKLNKQIDDLQREKKALQDSDRIVGEAISLEVNAKEYEKLRDKNGAYDDDYHKTESSKEDQKAASYWEQAKKKRTEAEECHQHHQRIEKEIGKISDQISVLENKRDILIKRSPASI